MFFKKNYKIIYFSTLFFLIGFSISSFVHNKKIIPTKDIGFLNQVWKEADRLYPFTEPDDKEKIYAAATGLITSYGDPYSSFYNPEETKQLRETITGEFVGAGMEIDIKNGLLVVIAPLSGSPAQKAGIKAGDVIITIDGESVDDKNIFEIIKDIRGEIGSEIVFGVIRDGEKKVLNITLVRDRVQIPVLKTQEFSDTFVISLYNFNEDSDVEFKKALEKFKDSSKKNILIDLRNNPGGYLKTCVKIASYFIEQGKVILYEDSGEETQKIYRSNGYSLLDTNYHLGILINQGSASASEILAGAIQDYRDGIILGSQSYGKGSVQKLIEMPNDTSLKMTIAHWLTPEKHQISHMGITPDVAIEGDSHDESYLRKAVQVFEKKIQL